MQGKVILIVILILFCVTASVTFLWWNIQITSNDLTSKREETNHGKVEGIQKNSKKDNTNNTLSKLGDSDTGTHDGTSLDVGSEGELSLEQISEDLRDKSVQKVLEDLLKTVQDSSSGSESNKGKTEGKDKLVKTEPTRDIRKERTALNVSNKDQSNVLGNRKSGDKMGSRRERRERQKGEETEGTILETQVRQLVNEARTAMNQGDYEKASELLQQSMELSPNSRDVLREMANLYKRTGDTQNEINVYQRWADTHPADPIPRYFLADTYRRQGNYDLAYRELQQFEQVNGNKPSTYAMSSGIYRQMGMREEEGRALTNWVNLEPNSPDARISLADYYRRMNDVNSAITQYQTAIQLAPGNIQPYIALGSYYSRLGMYNEAQQQFERVLQLQPNNSTAQLLSAQNYIRAGDVNSAIQMYQYIIQTSNDPSLVKQAQNSIQRLEQQLNRQQ